MCTILQARGRLAVWHAPGEGVDEPTAFRRSGNFSNKPSQATINDQDLLFLRLNVISPPSRMVRILDIMD